MTSPDPRDFNRPRRETLIDADVAGVAEGLLMLTRELWVVSDRLEIMQAVLEQRGIDIREEVEHFQPDADLQQRLNDNGQRLVSSVLNAIAALEPAESEPDS